VPLELQIIRACEFIRAGAHGRPDLEASRAVLRELGTACRRRGIDRALLDVRDIHPGATRILTPSELASLINTFRDIGFTHEHRLAVLYSEDPYHGVRLFALIGTLRGWKVGAFGDFESALQWLGEPENADEQNLTAPELPIRTRKTEGQ
jgi:hypothetical protein